MILLKNCLIDNAIKHIEINNKIISNVFENDTVLNLKKYKKIYNIKGNMVFPGMIDMHVHMRDMQLKNKETFETGSAAALMGGVTSFIDMPNTLPITMNLKTLNNKINRCSKNSYCNYGFYFSVNENTKFSEIKKCLKNILGLKIFLNDSTGNLKTNIYNLDKKIFTFNTLYLFHAENKNILKIEKLFSNKNARVHVCHISSKKEYQYFNRLKKVMPNATCEIAMHHLLLNRNSPIDNDMINVKPCLKTKRDNKFLYKHLEEIDCVASDHAPHELKEKRKNLLSGFCGVQNSFPLMVDLMIKNKILYNTIIKMCSENPAKILNLYKVGKIEKKYFADLVVVNVNKNTILLKKNNKSMCKWTPFDNWKLKGKIENIFINGCETNLNNKKQVRFLKKGEKNE